MKQANILVLEDNPSDITLLQSFFLNNKIYNHVIYAASIAQANELLRENNINLALIALQLPDGSGIDFARMLVSEHPAISMIMLSNSNDSDVLIECKRAGVEAFVTKPLSMALLSTALRPFADIHWIIAIGENTPHA